MPDITSHRIIVENWFGLLKTLWRIMIDRFKLKLEHYNKIFSFCAAVTNFHLSKHHLRRDHCLTWLEYLCVLKKVVLKKGNRCSFAFPKKVVPFTRYNDEGFLELQRNSANKRTVDFCPLLILHTNLHAHINVLKSEEMPNGSTYRINYVLKYNFKVEPNMIIEGQKIRDKVRFKARVVSVEEAVARIFSFTFAEKDIGYVFIDTVPPSLRTSKADKNEKQKQIDIIEKYYNRPSYLDRLTILDYFLLYNIQSAGKNISEEPPPKNLLLRPPILNQVPKNSVELNLKLDLSIQVGYLYKSGTLPNANRLKITKLTNARIVAFRNFDFTHNEINFYYHYLLISGCWRNEDDMMAGFTHPLDAIKHHGLLRPIIPDVNPGVGLYLLYHIERLRFTEMRLKKKLFRILFFKGLMFLIYYPL